MGSKYCLLEKIAVISNHLNKRSMKKVIRFFAAVIIVATASLSFTTCDYPGNGLDDSFESTCSRKFTCKLIITNTENDPYDIILNTYVFDPVIGNTQVIGNKIGTVEANSTKTFIEPIGAYQLAARQKSGYEFFPKYKTFRNRQYSKCNEYLITID